MTTNIVGPPVMRDDFFDRDRERARMAELCESTNLLVLAPRRVGKSSLLLQAGLEAEARKSFVAAYTIIGGVASEEEFVEKLYQMVASSRSAGPVLRHLRRGPLSRVFKKVESLKISVVELKLRDRPAPWKELGAELVETLRRQPERWLLMVDEVPIFVLRLLRADPSGERARVFLEWFRDLRQGPAQDKLRWVLAGSIGLDTVARRFRLTAAINDLQIFPLGPFDRDSAHGLLESLAATHDLVLSRAVRERICERAGWLIPFHLQVLFAKLLERCGDTGASEPDEAAVDAAFEQLLSPTHHAYFDTWAERLTEELGTPADAAATALLTGCALDPAGASRATLEQTLAARIPTVEQRGQQIAWLLEVLIGDGYLVEEKGRFRFRSNLLREFWRRKFAGD
jgi:hypothetical protein